MSCGVPFNIFSLESKELMELYNLAVSYDRNIEIEIIHEGKHDLGIHGNPSDVDLCNHRIRFINSLDKKQQIEAIAHELAHLLLLYKHGLRIVKRCFPGIGDERLDSFLQRITNTTHHLILIDLLKDNYRIDSVLHLRLLQDNSSGYSSEKELQYIKGLFAFECEKLIGKVIKEKSKQVLPFWKAYNSARKHFGKYSFQFVPSSSIYEEDVLSFLGDLGYQKKYFVFCP